MKRITASYSISVLVPVLARPQNVKPLVESFLAASSVDSSRLLFIVEVSDMEERTEIEKMMFERAMNPDNLSESDRRVDVITVPNICRRWSQKLNAAHRQIDREVDFYLLGADDLRFHKGWDDNPALQKLMADPKVGMIGTNDLGNPGVIAGRHSTHPLVRRSYVEENGIMEAANVIAPECYFHNFTDNEIVSIAKQRGAYAHCHDSVIEHLHPMWNKSKADDTYRLGAKRYAFDQALFQARKRMYGWE